METNSLVDRVLDPVCNFVDPLLERIPAVRVLPVIGGVKSIIDARNGRDFSEKNYWLTQGYIIYQLASAAIIPVAASYYFD